MGHEAIRELDVGEADRETRRPRALLDFSRGLRRDLTLEPKRHLRELPASLAKGEHGLTMCEAQTDLVLALPYLGLEEPTLTPELDPRPFRKGLALRCRQVFEVGEGIAHGRRADRDEPHAEVQILCFHRATPASASQVGGCLLALLAKPGLRRQAKGTEGKVWNDVHAQSIRPGTGLVAKVKYTGAVLLAVLTEIDETC